MTTEQFFLKTDRLGFRIWSEVDLDLALGLWGDFEVTKFFDKRGPLSRSQVEARLKQEIATQTESRVQYWPIFSLQTAEHIGCAGLRPYELSKGIYELGFHIRREHWGCGYATEAARAVIRYGFEELKASELFAGHNPKNEVSKKLLGKLGFRYSHDEYYEPTGLEHPSYFLSAVDYSRHQKMNTLEPSLRDEERNGES